jgi:hypothetical protein
MFRNPDTVDSKMLILIEILVYHLLAIIEVVVTRTALRAPQLLLARELSFYFFNFFKLKISNGTKLSSFIDVLPQN